MPGDNEPSGGAIIVLFVYGLVAGRSRRAI
jgi:hypothetical protein